jgi:tetratricopeptide (TPR) repeat protein
MAILLAPNASDAPWWHLERSYVYTSLEQPDKALADLSYAVQRWPNLWDTWVWRGGFHYAHQDWDEAIADYDRGLALNPKYWSAWWMRGVAATRLGRWDVALESYDKALAHNPEGAEYKNDLAWLLATCPDASLRDPARAVELARKVVEKEPQGGRYWITLGAAQYRAGQWQAAVEALDRAVELGWGNASALYFLAMAHWQLDQQDEARSWYDKAAQWMEANGKDNEELIRFRVEAEDLMKLE